MDLETFRRTLEDDQPPESIGHGLCALWHIGRDQWGRAHALIQTHGDSNSCWIHAHLHRIDGDLPNAAYWYSRAGRGMPKSDLKTEWDQIVTALLAAPA